MPPSPPPGRDASGLPRLASDLPLGAGAVLDGRFRLLDAIGRGGFGDVWRAEELLPNGAPIRKVALKLLSPDTDLAAWAGEASLLASFSHPALVTVLAAGLLPVPPVPAAAPGTAPAQVPFVAMELLEGETLGALLAREQRVPWRRVLAWARDVAAALDVIHARGVVHLDLKPSNLFLTEAGAVKVLDFGIARRLGAAAAARGAPVAVDAALGTAEFLAEHDAAAPASAPAIADDGAAGGGAARSGSRTRGPVIGTPGFIAPEVIEERPATAAADAYALAACVVQLSTGVLPQDVPPAPPEGSGATERRAFWAEVHHATSAGRLRDLEALGLPRGVAALCRRLLALDPDARGARPGRLRALLDDAWERPFGVPDPPYLGLVTLGPESEGMLFGRDDDVARLGRELSDHTVVVLQGVSGSGKSSLAMAGLVPHLARRDAARGPDWRAVVVRPGVDPDEALRRALAGVAPELEDAAPAEVAARCGRAGVGVAFVFDQLEELVTEASPERRGRLIQFLAGVAALPTSAPVRAMGTLREDFTSQLLSIDPLGERLRDALRFVGAPTAAAVREIVAQPARLAGVEVEGLGEVADDIQRELREGDGRLPLVALALAAFWRTRRPGEPLRASAWAALGGVRTIFADLADGVYTGLDPAAQVAARAVLLELCTDSRTRRRVPRADLRAGARDAAAFERATAAFVEAGLLVEAAGTLEVVHESLFSAWGRLEAWLSGAKASQRIAAALSEGARAWEDLGRPATRLPGAAEVALAEIALAEGGVSDEDADRLRTWLGAERARVRQARRRSAAAAFGGLVLAALALGAWAQTVSEAQRRAELAKQAAEQEAAKATDAQRQALIAQQLAEAAREQADKSRAERERAAMIARRQQEEFDQRIDEAKSELARTRVRCEVLKNAPRIKSGGCPPGDPLCLAGPPDGDPNEPPP